MDDARQTSDAALIDQAVAVCDDAVRRAPRDFLLMLALVLGTTAGVLLVAAAVTTGSLQDLLLNLGVEVIGTVLTVVLIDGLWKRQQAGATSTLQAMGRDLEDRRDRPLTEDERDAWRVFVDEYHDLVRAESYRVRARALPHCRRRIRALEARGNRTLERYRKTAVDELWPSS
jgi:hypothetical protein